MGILLSRSHGVRPSAAHFLPEALNGIYRKDGTQPFLASKALPDPVTPEFVAAVQEALSGLEKIVVTGDDVKRALLAGGSPATPEDLRKRFESFLSERCKGKDAGKLRFVIE